ncbi:MAG: YabP/YqfC family sporulation protein [Clostridia bacterium]|nr:YabP/YqfC family sporulation protein [Clostridia bacterium]
MRLFEEIFQNAEGMALTRCAFVPNGGGYFEGVKAVGDFSPERMILYFPKECIEIEGESLSIGKYCDGDLRLQGKISCVRVLGADGANGANGANGSKTSAENVGGGR